MDKDQAFQMIEEAKARVLGDDEVAELGEWARAAYVTKETATLGDGTTGSVLVDWITKYTKGTRQAQNFAENFKKVNRVVMPFVVKTFEDAAKK